MQIIRYILRFPFILLSAIFGRINWAAPPWLKALMRFRQTRPAVFWGLFATLIMLGAGYEYYQSLPKPITVKAEIRALHLTPNEEHATPDPLDIEFQYDLSELQQGQVAPQGEPSVARIDLVGETITQGIHITPAKAGRWLWRDDRHLQFEPESDWPTGTEYTVEFAAEIFVREARFSTLSYRFTTPAFSAEIASLQFYQDPQEINVRRAISTIRFSHPVDKNSFEQKLSMNMRPSQATIEQAPTAYAFSVTYDKNQREAYVQSNPISLPNEPNYLTLALAPGITSIFGGEPSQDSVEQKLLIPDIYSFLKVENSDAQIVRNEKNEPEQIVTLEFTDDIDRQELLDKLQLYLLPGDDQPGGKNYWESPRQVTSKVLNQADKQTFTLIENARDASKIYNLKIDVPENRFLYVQIAPGLTSVNRFVHAAFFDSLLQAPAYPKEVNIAGEGSLLTYSGEHQLSVLSRGVPALKYSIGRLLDGQINHLVSQTDGDISNPAFSSWNFQAKNIAEFTHKTVDIISQHPKQANYSSLDLTQYLPREQNRFGLFFINVQGWDKKNKRRIYGAEDNRLVLVTDLGLIVKNNSTDSSHEVFVQSIKTGLPVEGASVELLGKNGIPLFTKTTSAQGHAAFPSTLNLRDQQQPTVYVVKFNGDLSFIPFDRYTRQINLSKFDIGGVEVNHNQRNALNAYLFSDRGIYRPGEKVNLGTIVKNFDMSNVEGIPLEMVVRGPRNNEVKVSKLNLSKFGFFDFQYQTDATSDTGRYVATLHLIRENKYRGREIGSVDFKVEEFQPDTLKIASQLQGVADKGWSDKSQIDVSVSLQNLFGTPAQARQVKGRVIIRPANFQFKEYAAYHFTDPFFDQQQAALNLDKNLPEQITDADGMVHFNIDLQQISQGSYNLRFIAEGFEQGGGRSVVATSSALISPLSELVGYKADGKLDYITANSQRNIEFIAVNKTLQQLEKSNLVFKLLQIQNVSTLVRQYDGTYQYQTIKKESEISHNALSIPARGFSYAIDSSSPGDYAIEIIDSQQRRLSRLEYSVVGHGNLAGKLDKNAELQLKLNKSDYLPGEIIEMNIKAPYAGAGLITIESDKVQQFKWFKTDSMSSMQTIQLPQNLEGTGYVNVAFVRDFGSHEIFTSPLSYAVQPFSIDTSKRNIEVSLKVAEIVRPGKPMTIEYRASRPSKVALFAVDEGILQVANYATPDPLGHFLQKRALGVETLQIMDLILPEFELLKTLSASGGGMMGGNALARNLNPFARKTDQPAVFWSGIIDADSDVRSFNFDVPDTFAGSLRVMAVAVAEDAVGVSRQSTLVRGPFVISPNVLTQTAPGDEFKVTVGVANIIEGSGKNAAVEITVSASDHLTLLDNPKAQLKIDEGGEGRFSFRVKANQQLGAAELYFSVRHKNEESHRTVSLSVRPAQPYYASFTSGFEKDGTLDIPITRKLFANLAEQSVAASASPLVLVDGLSAYLAAFPHGCTEQVVSQVFPLVGLMSHPAYAPHVKDVNSHFAHLIKKLRERQLADGGFAFWPGNQASAAYPSIYAMHFLIEAQSLGYAVPTDMLRRGQDYLQDFAGQNTATLSAARDRANAIYLLSRLGMVTTNYLVDLEENLEKNYPKLWRKDLLAAYMAATYQLLQKDQEAQKLIAAYQLGDDTFSDNAEAQMDDFHSLLTRDSQYIYLLAKHFEDRARALSGEQLLKLTTPIFKGEYNTIAAAYSILALGAYSKLVLNNDAANTDEKDIAFFSKVAAAQRVSLNKIALNKIAAPFAKANYSVATDELSLESNKPLFYLNVQAGYDRQLPDQAVRQGIEVQRAFLDDEGNQITHFEQGKEITVRLRVRALENKKLSNIAVVDLLPGGFEIIRSSVSRTAYNWRADYVDIREDRIIIYGDFDATVRDLTYRVKLTAAGNFVVPPSFAESMYDRSIRGISKAGTFAVSAATNQ